MIGVFGSNPALKSSFLSSVGKKSETEGIIVYQRNEAGKKYSFLDDTSFPDKIQGYSRIASIVDYALYMLPQDGKLAPTDGELAVLLDSLDVDGAIEAVDSSLPDVSGVAKNSFKGLKLSFLPYRIKRQQVVRL